MTAKTAIVLSFISLGISIIVAILMFFSYRAARTAIRQASFQQKFTTFNIASQAMMNEPAFIYSVHGLDDSVSEQEARNIAYLGLLMDCFQCFYGWQFNGDFKKMVKTQEKVPTFLTKILEVGQNQQRWGEMKNLFYNELDAGFVKAIDSLIDWLKDNKQRMPSGSN